MFVRFGPTPAHEEPSNFWLTGSQRTIVGMVESKIDDRAYYHARFYRHDVFKSVSSCLRFTSDFGYFRRHDDVLKRLPCLQLKFQSSLSIGMMADFSVQGACTRKFTWRRIVMMMVFSPRHAYAVSFWRILNICFFYWCKNECLL